MSRPGPRSLLTLEALTIAAMRGSAQQMLRRSTSGWRTREIEFLVARTGWQEFSRGTWMEIVLRAQVLYGDHHP